MANKIKKFEKMIRGNPICQQESYEKEILYKIKFNELEHYKQQIFVNSFNHIKNDDLKEKCLNITTHYRQFNCDESYFIVTELSDEEKDKLKDCISECIQEECTKIIHQKEFIPTDLLQMIHSNLLTPCTLKSKLNNMLTLLIKYTNNKKNINNSLLKLLDSNNVNILKTQQLSKQIDDIKSNSYKLQNDIISKFSSENIFDSLNNYYKMKKNEYATNLTKLESLKKLQNEYEEIDGPQFRTLVKKFIQTQEMIKIKTEMYNSY